MTQNHPTTPESQLQWLVDRAQITDLAVRYARCVDEQRWASWAECFAADGTFEMADLVVAQTELAGWVAEQLRGYDALHHIMTNFSLEVTGDSAVGRHYLVAVHIPNRAAPDRHSDVAGWYDASYARTAAGWRFSRLRLTALWTAGEPIAAGQTLPDFHAE